MNYRILGFFENGFRHISNRTRTVRTPADLAGLRIRVLPSQIQARTFELLGAVPLRMDLTEAIAAIAAGGIDAQENPLSNTVTYGVHKFHRFHTLSNHFYISRPIFVHRTAFDAWPDDLKDAMRGAVKDAIAFQRDLHVREEDDARSAIEAAGLRDRRAHRRRARSIRRGGAADLRRGTRTMRRNVAEAHFRVFLNYRKVGAQYCQLEVPFRSENATIGTNTGLIRKYPFSITQGRLA